MNKIINNYFLFLFNCRIENVVLKKRIENVVVKLDKILLQTLFWRVTKRRWK